MSVPCTTRLEGKLNQWLTCAPVDVVDVAEPIAGRRRILGHEARAMSPNGVNELTFQLPGIDECLREIRDAVGLCYIDSISAQICQGLEDVVV